MKNYLMLLAMHLMLISDISAQTDTSKAVSAVSDSIISENSPSHFTYSIAPSFGLTFQNISKSDNESLTAQWLTTLDARMDWDDSTFGVASSLYLQYGQLHREGVFPEKTQDNLIFSITPSFMILPSWNIRLFFETTAETQMKEGMVDDIESHFLDPLFLYQTIFIGQKLIAKNTDETSELSLTYGIGYALQQTITDKFILESNRKYIIGPNNPLSNVQDQVTLESGFSGVFDFSAKKQIGEKLILTSSVKTVLLGKEETYKDYRKTRIGTLILAGISYGLFSLDYNMRLLYDSNYSLRRQLEQSLVMGVRLEL
ncbi:MAG: hypothetical protein HYZ54_14650 [Ignavibacteriae bacterium]|nr:hypothetical protein [Ignavibacteriota bacterium]